MKILGLLSVLNGAAAFMDCSKGSDSAKGTMEFVVTPFFPRRTARVVQCKYTITCNFGDYIKLMPDIIEIPCSGDNGIYVQEKGGVAGPFCGKKMMPAFVSKDVTVDVYINIEVPANGARAKIGYKTVSSSAGRRISGGRGLPESLKSGLNRPEPNQKNDPNAERNKLLQKAQDEMYEDEYDPSSNRRLYTAKDQNRWVSETSNERYPVYGRGNSYDDFQLSRGMDSIIRPVSKDGQMAKMAVPVVILMLLVAIVVPIMHQRRQKMKQDLHKIDQKPAHKPAPAVRPNYLNDLKKEPDFIPITPPETLQKKEEEAKQQNEKVVDTIKVPAAPANTISTKELVKTTSKVDSGIDEQPAPVKTVSSESKDSQATTAPSMISEIKSEATTTIVSGRPGRPK